MVQVILEITKKRTFHSMRKLVYPIAIGFCVARYGFRYGGDLTVLISEATRETKLASVKGLQIITRRIRGREITPPYRAHCGPCGC